MRAGDTTGRHTGCWPHGSTTRHRILYLGDSQFKVRFLSRPHTEDGGSPSWVVAYSIDPSPPPECCPGFPLATLNPNRGWILADTGNEGLRRCPFLLSGAAGWRGLVVLRCNRNRLPANGSCPPFHLHSRASAPENRVRKTLPYC